VVVTVDPHPVLTVVGRDVTMSRPVAILKALAGGWVTVPTLDGPRRLRLPPDAVTGTVLRMAGLGVGDKDRGDQLVTLEVEYPATLTPSARDALDELAAHLGSEAFPRTARFDKEHVAGGAQVMPSAASEDE